MAIVKTLDILLRGRIDKLSSDLRNGKKTLEQFATGVKDIFKSIFAGITFAAVTAKFRKVFEQLDGLAKRSDIFGIQSEQLGALERAADLAGVSVDKLATANKFLLVGIAAANRGTKANIELFSKLGTTARELESATAPERFVIIAKGLNQIESQAEKTAVALKLFGKQGLALLPLLSMSAKELAKNFAESKRLGILFNRGELAVIEEANDSVSTLGATFSAVFGRIGVQIGPSISNIARNLAEAIRPGTGLNGVMRGLGDTLKLVLQWGVGLAATIRVLSEMTGSFAGRAVGLAVGLFAVYRVSRMLVSVYRTLANTQKVLLLIETARAALNKVTAKQAAVALAAVAAMALAFQQFEASVQAAQDKVVGLNDEMMNNINLGKQMRAINVASAERGSQAALEQLFTVRTPLENQQVKLQQEGNAILGQIRDGISGVNDIEFGEGEEQGAF